MTSFRALIGAFAVGIVFLSAAQVRKSGDVDFVPAFISQPSLEQTILEAFPIRGQKKQIELPLTGVFFYGPSGDVIYGVPGHRSHTASTGGVVKLTFNPLRMESVVGSEGLSGEIVVPPLQDRIVIIGGYGATQDCGIFEIEIREGTVRKVLPNSSCEYLSLWTHPSISADGKRLLAYRKPNLELIDLSNGTSKSLSERYYQASWSPNGKWIAALSAGSNQTILLDAATFQPLRTLGASTGQWSPDSRYLLVLESGSCREYFSTIALLEVGSGRTERVQSSLCRVNLTTTGWIDKGVLGR